MQGPSCDLPLHDLNEMIQLNALSASTLTHLYGRDMKQRKRGRIMMLSSICGAVAGLPTVSVYAATKAFANSLALGLAKELEPHGVGVTCVMPGAVRDTGFKTRSQSEEALCWKVPFYSKTPQQVAEMAVRALLRGDTESTPGWQNRVFVKVMKPALPQRIHNIIAEIAWSPLKLPSWRAALARSQPKQPIAGAGSAATNPLAPPHFIGADGQERDLPNPEPHAPIRPSLPFQSPPRLLNIEENEKKPSTGENSTLPSTTTAGDAGQDDPNNNNDYEEEEDGAVGNEKLSRDDDDDQEEYENEEDPVVEDEKLVEPFDSNQLMVQSDPKIA